MSDPAEELELLAAEYVLGTLDSEAAQEVAARAKADPALAAAVVAWETRLAPLASLAGPVVPPDSLWRRIDASANAQSVPAAGLLLRSWRSVALWRCTTAAGVIAAAGALAALLWLRPLPPHPVAALVPVGSAAAAYVAELEPNGTLRVIALRAVSVAAGTDLALWALPSGAAHPVRLGLLPPSGLSIASPRFLVKATQLIVTMEPRGKPLTDEPTGPVLFTGMLAGAD